MIVQRMPPQAGHLRSRLKGLQEQACGRKTDLMGTASRLSPQLSCVRLAKDRSCEGSLVNARCASGERVPLPPALKEDQLFFEKPASFRRMSLHESSTLSHVSESSAIESLASIRASLRTMATDEMFRFDHTVCLQC